MNFEDPRWGILVQLLATHWSDTYVGTKEQIQRVGRITGLVDSLGATAEAIRDYLVKVRS